MLASLRFAAFGAGLDILSSFRRTGLGTLWPSLGVVLLVAALGTFFGTILRALVPDFEGYVMNLAAGMIAWTLLAGMLHQAANQTWHYVTTLRHAALPLPSATLRLLLRHLLILAQNLLLAAIAQRLLLGEIGWAPGWLLLGLLLLTANCYWMALLISLACARFRDLPQLVAWTVHLAFFLTPILWPLEFLTRYAWLELPNPFHHLVELVRAPLLGAPIGDIHLLACLLWLLLGGGFTWTALRAMRHRLPYWT